MLENLQIRDIDNVFADFLCDIEGGENKILRKAATYLSAYLGEGNICIELTDIYGDDEVDSASVALRLTKSVGLPGDYLPLVLDENNRLYLHRYWKYETNLAGALIQMAGNLPIVDVPLLRDGLKRLFPASKENIDWQKIAAAAAVRSRFCVISGGPGTGKTTTVVKIIALLLEQAKGNKMRIALAAPTGKAAARLKGSIFKAGKQLSDLTPVAADIPSEVSTIQALLGVIPDSCRFRYNADNPLPFEAVVIDEASMISLALMTRLVEALAEGTRLILLGDRDQLASVEAGAVFGDICNTGQNFAFSNKFQSFIVETAEIEVADNSNGDTLPFLADSVVVLRHNYRFAENSGIGLVSMAINSSNIDSVFDNMKHGVVSGITLSATPTNNLLYDKLSDKVVSGFSGYLQEQTPDKVLNAFEQFRVLCVLRQGLYGVDGINSLIERSLGDAGIIKPDNEWYHGRPVMILTNNYSLKLFNGDIGIALNDSESEIGLSVYFPSLNGQIRKYSPYRLPVHETVFAMTVHKSQGSEFEKVVLIMPPFQNQILTREILYTGITRARSSVELWCNDDIFLSTCDRTIKRHSGLRQALWV